MFGLLQRLVCAFGFLFSAYLLYTYEVIGICLGHCNPLNYSLGLIWFGMGILILKFHKYVNLWSAGGLAGIVYFVYLETIEGFCLYCTILHILGLTAIVLAQISLMSRLHHHTAHSRV